MERATYLLTQEVFSRNPWVSVHERYFMGPAFSAFLPDTQSITTVSFLQSLNIKLQPHPKLRQAQYLCFRRMNKERKYNLQKRGGGGKCLLIASSSPRANPCSEMCSDSRSVFSL